MTRDPERILGQNGTADALERELLQSLRDVGPKAQQKQAVWGALAAQLAAASVASAAQASSGTALKTGAASLLPKTLAAKVLVGAALGGSAITAAIVYLDQREPPPSAIPVATSIATAGPRAAPREPLPPTSPSANAPCSDCKPVTEMASPRRTTEPPKVDKLAEESALLTEARARLRGGDVVGAQGALDRLQQKFPRGVLAQEREVLSIELLSARGDDAAARRKARAFVSAHPKSPHSQRLGRFLEEP
jgi:hypothetical protein